MILRSRNDGTILDDYAYHCDRNLGPFSHRSGVGYSTFFFVVRRVFCWLKPLEVFGGLDVDLQIYGFAKSLFF